MDVFQEWLKSRGNREKFSLEIVSTLEMLEKEGHLDLRHEHPIFDIIMSRIPPTSDDSLDRKQRTAVQLWCRFKASQFKEKKRDWGRSRTSARHGLGISKRDLLNVVIGLSFIVLIFIGDSLIDALFQGATILGSMPGGTLLGLQITLAAFVLICIIGCRKR